MPNCSVGCINFVIWTWKVSEIIAFRSHMRLKIWLSAPIM